MIKHRASETIGLAAGMLKGDCKVERRVKGEGCPSNSYPMLPPQLHSTFPAPVSHAFPVNQEFLKEHLNTSFPGLLRAPETRGEAKSLKS